LLASLRGSAAERLRKGAAGSTDSSSRQPAFATKASHVERGGGSSVSSALCEEERRLRRLIISKFNPYPPRTGPQAAGSRPKQKVSHSRGGGVRGRCLRLFFGCLHMHCRRFIQKPSVCMCRKREAAAAQLRTCKFSEPLGLAKNFQGIATPP
jgi:hypothetical protein